MLFRFRTLGLLTLLAAACQRRSVPTATTASPLLALPVETGVSQQLAEMRKQVLSQLGYALRLNIPLEKTQPIGAQETITFTLRDNRQPLQLDFKAPADHLGNVAVNGRPVPLDYRNEHLVLPASALRVGRNEVKISFTAGDQSLNRNADYLYTLLVPDRARTVFPVFDQPDLKAIFTLSLQVPSQWQAVANGMLRDSSAATLDGRVPGFKVYRFAPSDSISTYLFSFAAGKFTPLRQMVAGRPMNFYHRETDSTKIRLSVPAIFRLHGEALRFLEDYTGIPYPFQKFDFTSIPDFQYGGMEHVGNIDYKAASLFLDDGATKDQLVARQNLIGHETAHMWFGDLVTMRWFNDVWMKEVFANFMADKMSASIQSDDQLLKFLTDHYPAAYAVDRTRGANAIRQPLANLQDAGSLYGNIIYHKAPIMMRQLEGLMGEENFRAGVREYLKKYAHGNATWPDLITILDTHTPADLAAWNQVWVNEPGRPVFSYEVQGEDGKIKQLLVHQRAEDGSGRIWPQRFDVALVSPTGQLLKIGDVNSDQATVAVPWAVGQPLPAVAMLNYHGLGYGVFPVSSNLTSRIGTLTSKGLLHDQPSVRAALYITLYENMLNDRSGSAGRELLDTYQQQVAHETNELNIKLLTNQLSDIFWKFIPASTRAGRAPGLEDALWQAMLAQRSAGAQKLYFKAYQGIALSAAAQARLYKIWQTQQPPVQVKLTEDDYTSLALALAVRAYSAPQPILPEQLARIKNVDRRQRLEFMMPALSPDVAVRDQFFASLKDEKNREKEAWVTATLGYLHHPLRQATSEKYLPASLDLLAEIQATGDIFFPASWLQSTLGSYQSATAARTVQAFLTAHPASSYNPQLRLKLLQAADDLFRAQKM
jgi:aminopeptidase N